MVTPSVEMRQLFKPEYLDRIPEEETLFFDFSTESDSADFYNKMTLGGTSPIAEVKEKIKSEVISRDKGDTPPQTKAIVDKIRKRLDPESVVLELGGGFHQRRSGYLYQHFANYLPLDISYTHILRYTESYGRPGVVADAQKLPFKDNSVDCVFTHTFLEHPLNPDLVLKEIARIVKPGGLIVHADAWFCRWWQRFGIVDIKPFGELTPREKMIYLMAKISEFPLLRFPPIIAGRLLREIFIPSTGSSSLRYQSLKPNYDLYLGCDEDAASTIDPLDVIRFYEGRGGKAVDLEGLYSRVFFRNSYVMIER